MPVGTIQNALSEYENKERALGAAKIGAAETVGSFPQVSGPTASSVNSAFAGQQPATFAEFAGRGGIQNTIQDSVNKVRTKMEEKKLMANYIQLLESGERGADALYRDAQMEVGEEASMYVPQRGMREWGTDKEKVSFYDDKGIFLPRQYANAVGMGVLAWRKDQKVRAERAQAGNVIAGAPDRQAAAAGVLQTGQDIKPYENAVSSVPTPQDQAQTIGTLATADKTAADTQKAMIDIEYLPAKYQAEANKLNAEATKIRSEITPGGKRSALLVGLEGQKTALLKQLGESYRFITDNSILKDPKKMGEITKHIKRLESDYESINEKIAAEEEIAFPGTEVHPPKPSEASEEAVTAAQSIMAGMSSMPPKGMVPKKNELGAESYSRKELFGEGAPDQQVYSTELAFRTKDFLKTKGVENVSETLIAEMLKTDKLEDVISDILWARDNLPKTAPIQPNGQAGTIQ